MRLTLKLVLVFMLGNIVLAAIYGYLAVQHEVRAFQRTVEAEAQSLGPAMEDLLVESWRSAGYERVLEVIRKANDGKMAKCASAGCGSTPNREIPMLPRQRRNALRRLSCSSTGRWSRFMPMA